MSYMLLTELKECPSVWSSADHCDSDQRKNFETPSAEAANLSSLIKNI